jgi:type IV pilus assembly protein PilC
MYMVKSEQERFGWGYRVMPSFVYSTHGDGTKRRIAADNLPQALLRLKDDGVSVQSIDPDEQELDLRLPLSTRRLLPSVYTQLAGMLDEGLGIGESLRRIAAELRAPKLRLSLMALGDAADDGLSLSEAMARQPAIYAATVRAAVRSGETTGDLPGALRGLSEHQRALMLMSRGLSLPLIYPVFILAVAGAYMVFIATFIFPKFMQLFMDLGMEGSDFPAPTRMAIVLSRVTPMIVLGLVIAFGALWLAWRAYDRSRRGMYTFGLWRLRLPVVGRVALYTALARATSTLAMLLRGGVDTVTALRLASDAAGDLVVSTALRRAEAVYQDGGSIVEGLRETHALPDEFVFRMGVAQSEGYLADVLDNIASDYMEATEQLVRRWVIIAGPVTVILLGIVVGFVATASFLPLIGIISNLSQ